MHAKLVFGASLFIVLYSMNIALSFELRDSISPTFFDSMSTWGAYDNIRIFDTNRALTDLYVPKAKESYETFWVNNLQIDSSPRIPKIIHQIWLGSPFPEKYKVLQQSWKKYHPDWTYILWTEKEIKDFGLTNRERFDKAKIYG